MLLDLSRRVTGGGGFGPRRPAGCSRPPLERWTLFALRHRSWVVAIWLAVLVVGAAASTALPRHLVNSFEVPGTDSARATSALQHGFGERPEGTFTAVFRVGRPGGREVRHEIRVRLKRASRVLPNGRLGTVRLGAGVVYGELETTLGLQQAKGLTGRLRRALRGDRGPAALVTGQPAVQHDLDPILASDLRRGQEFAIPLTLLVLVGFLGLSLALALPFAFAACTIAATLALLYVFARLVEVSPYAINLVELIGLGLAVDYALLVVCRYREQLGRGRTRNAAIVETMATAGRAVVFSGAAVAIGLALLLFVPVPFIRTMGLGGLLIPLVSILAALTLQPALLSFCGARVIGPVRLPRVLRARAPWGALARLVMKHRWLTLLATVLVLLAGIAPIRLLQLTPGSLASLPHGTEAARGLVALRDGFGPGALTPTQVVVDGGSAGAAREPVVHAAIERLADRLFHDPEVYVVALGRSPPYVSSGGRYARVLVVGRHEFGEKASRRLVGRLRSVLVPAARFPARTRVTVGGAAPQGVDFLARAYAFFPWLVVLALALTYLVLMRAFRSLLLPLKTIVLNLLSVAASYGLLVAIFYPTPIEGWIPIFLFATLFGLSMDYEVFMVSRMREAWDNGAGNTEAVALGLERTGGLITASALVMAASFGGFVIGSIPGLRQFGTGLVIAVLLDATLVRALLVPAVMAIMGAWNWWLPGRLTRLAPNRVEEPVDA